MTTKKLLPWTPALLLGTGLAGALSLQHLMGWVPCPLCVVQRLSAIALLLSLCGFAYWADRPRWRESMLALAIAALLAGLAGGGAHLWVLAHPSNGTCGPGVAMFVENMLEGLPGFAWLLKGVGSCADAEYAILGMPLPLCSMLLHAGATGLAARVWLQRRAETAKGPAPVARG